MDEVKLDQNKYVEVDRFNLNSSDFLWHMLCRLQRINPPEGLMFGDNLIMLWKSDFDKINKG